MEEIIKELQDPDVWIEIRKDNFVIGYEVTVGHRNKGVCRQIFLMEDVLRPGFEIAAKNRILKMIKDIKG